MRINCFLSHFFSHFFCFFLPSQVWNEDKEAPKGIKTFTVEDRGIPKNAVNPKKLNMMETVKRHLNDQVQSLHKQVVSRGGVSPYKTLVICEALKGPRYLSHCSHSSSHSHIPTNKMYYLQWLNFENYSKFLYLSTSHESFQNIIKIKILSWILPIEMSWKSSSHII